MGSIEYILTNIAGIDEDLLSKLRGNIGGFFDFKGMAIKGETGPHLLKLIDAILNLDGASSKNLGSSELAESNPGSIENFLGLSSTKEEAPKAN